MVCPCDAPNFVDEPDPEVFEVLRSVRLGVNLVVVLLHISFQNFSWPLLLRPLLLDLLRVEFDKVLIDLALVHHLESEVIGAVDLLAVLLEPPNEHQVVVRLVLFFVARQPLLRPAWLYPHPVMLLFLLNLLMRLWVFMAILNHSRVDFRRLVSFQNSPGLALGECLPSCSRLEVLASLLGALLDFGVDQAVDTLEAPVVCFPFVDSEFVLE